MQHTVCALLKQPHHAIPFVETLLVQALPPDPPTPKGSRRGAPQKLSWPHLWFALLVSVLCGMSSYQDLWRRVCSQAIGPFPPVHLTDDALIKRLKHAGLAPFEHLFTQISQVLRCRLQPLLARFGEDLAPFATDILALDETTWDAVQRHLPSLRQVPNGDRRLLPGKLAARFNIRTQQWDFLQVRVNPVANCKWQICSLLDGVKEGALLLFDLGYFSFPFFDWLAARHLWFICRLQERVHYQVVQTFYRHEGTLDALVWLGSTGRNSSRTAYLLRLVRFWDGSRLRWYLTNQTDPHLLSLPSIARLYARRWDIELAFLTIKEHLGLHHWWSADPVLRQQQVLLILLTAQIVQAIRLLVAAEAGRDPFEVSLPLLSTHLPHLLLTRQHPVSWVCTYGPSLGFFRSSSRCHLHLPVVPLDAYQFPPDALPRIRRAIYAPCPDRPHRPASKTPRRPSNQPKHVPLFPAPVVRQLSLFSPHLLRSLRRVDP